MSKKLLYLCFALVLVLGFVVGCQKEAAQPVQEKACIYAKCDSYVANGADILFYSDDRSSLTAAIYGDSGNVDFTGTASLDGVSVVLGAGEAVAIDGDTTNQTQTGGALNIDVGTVTANVSGFNVAVTQDNGTDSGTDSFAGVITLTQNDADGDLFGIKMTAAATTNAAANSYEYGYFYDCAENTAGACIDGILLTSTGANTGMTDGLDVSASNILYAVNVGSNPVLGGNSDSFTIGASDAVFAVTRNDSGSVTYTCADDDANATCVYDSGGTGSVNVGSADTASIALTTDGTGDAEVSVSENSIGPDEVAVMHDWVIACGQADENGTIYYGPATAVFGGDGSTSYAISSVACDALDNATEATADAPIFTNVAFKITGLYCKQSGTLGAGEAVTFTVRSAAADTTPVISCTVSEGETDCRSLTGSTTDIAAGATLAVKAVQVSDNTDDDHWCKVYIAYK